MTGPIPVCLGDDILLRGDKRWDGAHPISVFRAPLDTSERRDCVIYYDTNLFVLSRGTGKNWELPRPQCRQRSLIKLTLELHIC